METEIPYFLPLEKCSDVDYQKILFQTIYTLSKKKKVVKFKITVDLNLTLYYIIPTMNAR